MNPFQILATEAIKANLSLIYTFNLVLYQLVYFSFDISTTLDRFSISELALKCFKFAQSVKA